MCGILCIFGTQPENDVLNTSFELLISRGPDAQTITRPSETTYLAFSRLKVMDLTSSGNQPFILDDTYLICNGEIFNHKQLEDKYDIKCTGTSDCEFIIHLIHKIGFMNTISELDGTFAIVYYEQIHNKLYLGRDRLGVCPLFISVNIDKKFIAVSSIAKSLDVLSSSNISQVIPMGVIYDIPSLKMEWQIYRFFPQIEIVNENMIEYNLRYILKNAVKKRLMSDRPIACLLSGGLDSSIIAAILCKLLPPSSVKTYSVGMKGSIDLRYAKLVSEFLGTVHTEVIFTKEEALAMIPEVVQKTETFDITTIRASVPMCLLSKYISTHTNDIVIFSGEGSDELFGGYLYFHNAPSPLDFQNETLILLKNLLTYDVLRADRSTTSYGLEIRVPFLDIELVDFVVSLDPGIKMPRDGMEKYILRHAFREFLPDSVVWRRKEAFSDGCSEERVLWKDIITEYVETLNIGTLEGYPSKEAKYYHSLFKKYFNNYSPSIQYWMPKWVNRGITDPSATVLNIGEQHMFQALYSMFKDNVTFKDSEKGTIVNPVPEFKNHLQYEWNDYLLKHNAATISSRYNNFIKSIH